MLYRGVLLLLACFWVAMNVLLWRAEYGRHDGQGGSVPAEVIWQKILTAPDSSSLAVLRNGKHIGFCHWSTRISEELSEINSDDAAAAVRLTPPPSGYRLQLEGNVALDGPTNRLRFDGSVRLASDKSWQEFGLRLNLRPISLELHSLASEPELHVTVNEAEAHFERLIRLEDLRNPEMLLREAGPVAGGMLAGLGWPGVLGVRKPSEPVLHWVGRNDWLRLGHSAVRVYRLEAHLLDRFSLVVFASRAGEILRVELPEHLVLINDQVAAP